MEIPTEVVQAAPGAVGSAIALRWLDGPWGLKITTWLGGAAISYFSVPGVAWLMTLEHKGAISLLGLVFGLFGMLAVSKVYEFIASLKKEDILSFIPWKR